MRDHSYEDPLYIKRVKIIKIVFYFLIIFYAKNNKLQSNLKTSPNELVFLIFLRLRLLFHKDGDIALTSRVSLESASIHLVSGTAVEVFVCAIW